jgi:UDP-N-acetylmuramoyl-tripeptide--D-alanyl-D-alanine ligase
MSIWNIQEIAEATQGQLIQAGTAPLNGVSKDTRENLNEKIFFALKGERYDAHDFLDQAIKAGVAALVVSNDFKNSDPKLSIIKVKDTLSALQEFASWHRSKWKGKMVGLTGSNGKTTTKEFIFSLLNQKQPTLATQGNLNNHIGVPLTLLELRSQHKFAVVEMGMNHAGEITELVLLSTREFVLVTKVRTANFDFFGSVVAFESQM